MSCGEPPRPPGAMLKPLRAMLTSLSPPTSPRAKAKELHDWIQQLESEKFDLMEKLRRQKYEVGAEWGRLECLGGGVILGSLGDIMAASVCFCSPLSADQCSVQPHQPCPEIVSGGGGAAGGGFGDLWVSAGAPGGGSGGP